MKTVDVGVVLDEGHWSGYQKLLIFGTALAIILDGIDNQLLGNAIPSMMTDWSLPRGAFTTALAAGPLGMMFGGMLGGMLGDRVGRRTALLSSVTAFAGLTLAIATVNSVPMLTLLRFVAGLGLGGAMPNAAALASEYVPRRQRAFAVTLTIVCIPLGGALAAQLSAVVLPTYGWRPLFVLGGIIPIVLALVLFRVLPESPRYLASHPNRWPELVAMLRKAGHTVPADASFVETGTGKAIAKSRASIRDLFASDFRLDTIGLFGAFFFCLLANYIGILLIPVMLREAGFQQAFASNALGAWNYGGVAGAIMGALIIQRLGSRITMLSLSGIAIASAFVMAAIPPDPQRSFQLIVLFVILGGSLNAVQTTMYALAANVYPTEIRGTGIGTAVAVGRIGNVLASYVGMFALDRGTGAYFMTFAVTMIIVFASLALVRRHIERTSGDIVAAKLGAPAGH